MATVYGVNRTKYLTPIGANLVDQGVNKGNVCAMYDTYEASALADGDVIQVCDTLPVGAMVVGITLISDDLGSAGVTLAVGDGASSARYISATAHTSANTVTHMNVIGGVGYQVTGVGGDDQIAILGGGLLTNTISIIVLYSI